MNGANGRQALLGIAATGAMLAAGVKIARSATRALGFSTYLPSRHPLLTGVLKPFAEDVAAAGDGRVVIEFTAASPAPPPRRFPVRPVLFLLFPGRVLFLPEIMK